MDWIHFSNLDLYGAMNDMNLRDGKHWIDLPPELKLECIKWMDFKTRWELRQTSSTEKELVENTKCDILEVQALEEIIITYFTSPSSRNILMMPLESSILKSVLKMGKIGKCLIYCCDRRLFRAVRELSGVPLNVKNLILSNVSKSNIPYLRNFRGLESLDIGFLKTEHVVFSDLEQIYEMIINVKDLWLMDIHSFPANEMQKWILNWIVKQKETSSTLCIAFAFRSSENFKTAVDIVEHKFTQRKCGYENNGNFYIPMKPDKCIVINISLFGMTMHVVKSDEG